MFFMHLLRLVISFRPQGVFFRRQGRWHHWTWLGSWGRPWNEKFKNYKITKWVWDESLGDHPRFFSFSFQKNELEVFLEWFWTKFLSILEGHIWLRWWSENQQLGSKIFQKIWKFNKKNQFFVSLSSILYVDKSGGVSLNTFCYFDVIKSSFDGHLNFWDNKNWFDVGIVEVEFGSSILSILRVKQSCSVEVCGSI